jgi:hypothetical protein
MRSPLIGALVDLALDEFCKCTKDLVCSPGMPNMTAMRIVSYLQYFDLSCCFWIE